MGSADITVNSQGNANDIKAVTCVTCSQPLPCGCAYCRNCFRDLRADAYCDCSADGHCLTAADIADRRADEAYAQFKDEGSR